ncbi:MAG: response regulator [Chloroflexi bacterium]|nr:MAG: response regulator [Chloroflexota bacterium]
MQIRILYVEDHPQNMLLVRRIVEAEGYELLEAENGTVGWETAVSQKPDLILMDLHLPGAISGIELTKKLKQDDHLRSIPVIALTAYGHGAVEEMAMAAGCDDFLHKPADIRQIRAAIKQHLNLQQPQTQPAIYAFI